MNILLIEDDPIDADLIMTYLDEDTSDIFASSVVSKNRLLAALSELDSFQPDIILADLSLPDCHGIDTVVRLISACPHIPIVVLTGLEDQELSLKAVRIGAQDYLYKGDISGQILERSIGYAIERKQISKKLALANRKMTSDLEDAKIIQHALLPKEQPSNPQLKTAYVYKPMDQIGGDGFDFFEFPDGKFGGLVFDVTGHGLSAALFSFMILGLFRTMVSSEDSPDQVYLKVNEGLVNQFPEDRFATAFYWNYDLERRHLAFSAAGHPPAFLIQNGKVVELETEGMMLGMLEHPVFRTSGSSHDFGPGDKLFAFSDGIYEVTDENDQMFGEVRLKQLVNAHAHLPIDQLLKAVYASVLDYSRDKSFNDDITLVGLEVSP